MFNKSQIEAISHKEGPAIVLAGPGSGKTTVITHRIKNLIESAGIPPENILVVTFTKAAAVHMKERFLEIMNGNNKLYSNKDIYDNRWLYAGKDSQKSYPVTFGTFHSIFYRVIRLTCDYKKDCIVTDRTKYDYIKEIVIRLNIDVSSMQEFVQSVSGEISRFKGNMQNIDAYHPSCCKRENFKILLEEYEKTLEIEQKIDFEDMLLKCYRLLLERGEVLKQWQEVFQYILIDEFQDINRIQYEIIKLLALPQNNIFIVGDDDQSIYGFRGACPEIMFQFQKDYPARKILLNINYRSVPEIVELSQNLIVHNKDRFNKKIISSKENGIQPDIRKFRNQGEELKYLCYQVKKYRKKGIRLDEMAILVRNNSQISVIRDFLQNEMLYICDRKGDNSIYQGMVAKDVIAYVKAALYEDYVFLKDNKELIYILNKPQRFISRRIIGQDGMDFDRLMRTYSHNREVLKNIEQLKFHMEMIGKLNPSAALTYIRNGTGYEKYLQQYAIENKIKLAGLLKQFDDIQKEALEFETLVQWLDHVENPSQMQNKNEKGNGIHIMTMHGAKGLEFRVVFIIDANQGIIPSSRAVRERDFQEERRVFYVAMTRASEILNIYGIMESLGCSIELSMFIPEALESDFVNRA